MSKTSNDRTMLLSKYESCGSNKSRFIEEQDVFGLLSIIGSKDD